MAVVTFLSDVSWALGSKKECDLSGCNMYLNQNILMIILLGEVRNLGADQTTLV